ncbi:PREDICTED: uncharacterized protein LOC105504474 [Colobus angolensis palliatus]|uniref:uncharacterized protein LOC105504474 n=1 Tax=Colobus angolensis palliatus TaxID=336983 RepID=UPI0005F47845|nr:PREDICTED: uncharacterized protein LOC105504474 [Colobus angolensis palliatus]
MASVSGFTLGTRRDNTSIVTLVLDAGTAMSSLYSLGSACLCPPEDECENGGAHSTSISSLRATDMVLEGRPSSLQPACSPCASVSSWSPMPAVHFSDFCLLSSSRTSALVKSCQNEPQRHTSKDSACTKEGLGGQQLSPLAALWGDSCAHCSAVEELSEAYNVTVDIQQLYLTSWKENRRETGALTFFCHHQLVISSQASSSQQSVTVSTGADVGIMSNFCCFSKLP